MFYIAKVMVPMMMKIGRTRRALKQGSGPRPAVDTAGSEIDSVSMWSFRDYSRIGLVSSSRRAKVPMTALPKRVGEQRCSN